jgi:RNA polymerase sigma factor (sigma-70 family)
VGAPDDPERKLLAAALRGDAAAAAGLMRTIADPVWTACRRVTADDAEAEATFREVMASIRERHFARLEGYDGRAPVRVYLALVVRDLLAERVVRLLALDAARGWLAFQGFFADDMRRIIARLLPGGQHQLNREDAYQAVCEALLKNDLQRLRAYSGRGSPAGFVLQVIENLVIDHVRTVLPRRRVPAAVERLAALDQAIFRLIYWERLPPDPPVLLPRVPRGDLAPTLAEVSQAIARVRLAVPVGYLAASDSQTVDLSVADNAGLAAGAEEFAVPTPEDEVMGAEAAAVLEQALATLRAALPRLSAQEQLYLKLALAGHPAREIAALAGLPVETVHRLGQQVKRHLRQEIGGDEAVQSWKLSVQ